MKHLCAGLLAGALGAAGASANPAGPQVTHGQAGFAHPDPATLNVTNTPGTVINWQQFSIGAAETTRFIQSSPASAVLNRVIGQDPSSILGRLLSNGRVFLINRNGIVFGENAVVDTAGLVASTLDMTDEDFIAGELRFEGEAAGAIRNLGFIKAGADGDIYLIAPDIENSGIIETIGGEILLAAGESVAIASLDSDHIVFEVQAPDNQAVNLGEMVTNGGAAKMFAGTIRHSGSINADSVGLDKSGRVTLRASSRITLEEDSVISASSENAQGGNVHVEVTASSEQDSNSTLYQLGDIHVEGRIGGNVTMTADSILTTARINSDGIDKGGSVDIYARDRILATVDSSVSSSGRNGDGGEINVHAENSLYSSATYSSNGRTGGRIKLQGAEVKLANAQVDASGRNQGGDIRVGGGFGGQEADMSNAETTQVNGTTTLSADAIAGDGGTVVVWADGETRFSGSISAKGGANQGNGGVAEVSGKQGLTYNGLADLSAANGNNGDLLLDPENITISSGPAGGPGFTELLDPNPNASDFYGQGDSLLLSTGMLLHAESFDGFAASNAGAVYLFNPDTGALLATLTGSQANDQIGAFGNIYELTNGNYVVVSELWDNGAVANAGAVTWGDGSTGVSGVVSAANSLVGTTAQDRVGTDGITVLTNGNYVVVSPEWNNTGASATDAGAVTWANGLGGTTGAVSAANSLVGTFGSERIGTSGVTALTNGNYVVGSHLWRGSAFALSRGAATFADGTTGITGTISAANSLVGTSDQDRVAISGITALTNGNYVVGSRGWNGSRGAATWADGTTGITGAVSAGNSLIGSSSNDNVGTTITALSNGNYVVGSDQWTDGGTVQAGAATWADGTTGITGTISAANSLIGSTALDRVSSGGIFALANGNFVVVSEQWDNGGTVDAGAVTWGSGLGGTVGAVSAANSLVGSTASDEIGNEGVVALTNGNYVVVSEDWDNGGVADAGAVTWANGLGGTTGTVSAANSLVGSTANDQVGSDGVTALTNGNYVVASRLWDDGGIVNAGAATWGDGTTGISGTISAANSLIGSTTADLVGFFGVTALVNGNYVVASGFWDNGASTNAGAVTWGNGLSGTTGIVSAANSLVGSTTNDQVGVVTALSNGNYVVTSGSWDNDTIIDAGAVTLGNGVVGTVGAVNPMNSLVGFLAGDGLGGDGSLDMGGGKYAIFSGSFNNVAGADSGQILVVNPGGSGAANSLFSDTPGADAVVTDGAIEATLNAGTALILQANNDITIGTGADINVVAGGAGGDLTLQAGRSILLNANVFTDGGDLTLVANDTLANGVVTVNRAAGAASITMASGTIIDLGAGGLTIDLRDGAGRTGSQALSGMITLADISAGSVTLAGGTVDGTGTITANVNNTGATLAPGASPGTLVIAGNYVQGPGGLLDIELGGTAAAGVDYDLLSVTGTATLDGTLNIQLFGGFTGAVGDQFDVINSSDVINDFAVVNDPAGYVFSASPDTPVTGAYQLEITSGPFAPPPSAPVPDPTPGPPVPPSQPEPPGDDATLFQASDEVVILNDLQLQLVFLTSTGDDGDDGEERKELICR